MTPIRPDPRSFLACLLALTAGFAEAGTLTAEIHHIPSPLPTPNGRVLVYELAVRNFSGACARIVDVRAFGDGEALRRYQGSSIAPNTLVYDAQMQPLPNPAAGQTRMHPVDLPAGGGAVVYFFLALDNNLPLPARLQHEVDSTACSAGASTRSTATTESAISRAAPVMVGLPFRGTGWVAGDSANDFGTHRRTLIPGRRADGSVIVGQFSAPERYAIDWVKVDDQARRAIGPLDRNASYLAWGEEIIAVADGVIAGIRDGMPESTPPRNPPNPTVEMAGGNYIMQDIGGGHFAFYAHLQPGSLRVRVGQPVQRGQLIARLGNSGNTSEPHLHFHVSSNPDPLYSEGLPYVFERYELTGQANDMEDGGNLFSDLSTQAPSPKFSLMPASYSVLNADVTVSGPAGWAFPILYPNH